MEELRNYLTQNIEELQGVVAEINGYNGSLDYLEVWENEEDIINEIFPNPYEAIRSSFFGGYNFYDMYIRLNAYSNIESLSEYEYEIELKENVDDIIEELLRIFNQIDISDKIQELIKKML